MGYNQTGGISNMTIVIIMVVLILLISGGSIGYWYWQRNKLMNEPETTS